MNYNKVKDIVVYVEEKESEREINKYGEDVEK
jgi:hypothetical protein